MILLNDYGVFNSSYGSSIKNIKLSKYGKCDVIIKEATELTKIQIDEDNPNYILQDDILFSKDMKTLYFYSRWKSNTTYTIPNEVETIGNYAFRNCNNLIKVEMSNSITQIGSEAFRKCSNLKEIKLSENLKEISTSMFNYCIKLEELDLPNSIETIRGGAFYNCEALKNIFIPNSIITIFEEGKISSNADWYSTFGYCENLLVTVESGSPLQLSDFTDAGLDESQVIFE